jgi:hypothetical protein
MYVEGKVGVQNVSDGSQTVLRTDKTGVLVTTQGHGGYTEAAVRGTIMEVSTAVAGVAPGTVLSTTPPIILWNPPSSGKNLAVLKASMGYLSGTLGAGSILLAYNPSQATVPTTGAELTPVCSLLGFPRGVGRVFQASTISATPLILRALFTMGAFVGTTASVPTDTVDVIDGSIIVTPGTCLVMQGLAGAGTSPLVLFGLTWEEIPA